MLFYAPYYLHFKGPSDCFNRTDKCYRHILGLDGPASGRIWHLVLGVCLALKQPWVAARPACALVPRVHLVHVMAAEIQPFWWDKALMGSRRGFQTKASRATAGHARLAGLPGPHPLKIAVVPEAIGLMPLR